MRAHNLMFGDGHLHLQIAERAGRLERRRAMVAELRFAAPWAALCVLLPLDGVLLATGAPAAWMVTALAAVAAGMALLTLAADRSTERYPMPLEAPVAPPRCWSFDGHRRRLRPHRRRMLAALTFESSGR